MVCRECDAHLRSSQQASGPRSTVSNPPAEAVADDLAADLGDALDGETEAAQDLIAGRRSAEVVDADDRAVGAGVALPAERAEGLDRDSLAVGPRQNGLTVARVLRLEPLPAGQADDAAADAFSLQRFRCPDCQLQLRACGDQDQVGPGGIARCVAQDVAAARHTGSRASLPCRPGRAVSGGT